MLTQPAVTVIAVGLPELINKSPVVGAPSRRFCSCTNMVFALHFVRGTNQMMSMLKISSRAFVLAVVADHLAETFKINAPFVAKLVVGKSPRP